MALTNTEIIARLIAAFLVPVFASISLECPRHLVFKSGPIGVLSYSIYLFGLYNNLNDTLSVFLACFVASVIAQFAARRFRAPVTLFYIPVFFIYVPGSAIYQAAYHLIDGSPGLAGSFLVITLLTAGAIALGVFISDSIFEIYFSTKMNLAAKRRQQARESE